MRMLRIAAVIVSLSLLCLPAAAMADEITDQLERGLKLYKDGKVSEALEELNFAMAQMRQVKADSMQKIFPDAPSGWEAQKPETQAAGAGMLGGGISASQSYRQKDGNGQATIEVMTDSPLVQSLGMMLSNPMFLQGGKNGRLLRINGEKAVLKDEGKRAEVMMLLDGKILIKVEVRGMDKAGDVAKSLTESMDLKKVRELAG